MDREHGLAISICKTLQDAGYQAVLCGGCVRDMFLGRIPHDYDIATSAKPDQVISLFKNSKLVGKSFGVVLVKMDDLNFEVATFRNDGIYKDGRHPEKVIFSTMEEDAKRRDFTVNALFFDPLSGETFDFVGGINDLQTKTLSFVGDPLDRVNEDVLRMLRFVRFLAKLNFRMDTSSFFAVKNNSSRIKLIPTDRIMEELVGMFKENDPKRVVELLYMTGLLSHILPCINRLETEEQDPIWHPEGNCFKHTLLALNQVKEENYILKLAVLFHDVGKPDTHEVINGRIATHEHHKTGADIAVKVLTDLRFSNNEIEQIRWLIYNHMKKPSLMKKSKLKKLMAHPQINDLVKLMRADGKAAAGNTTEADFLEAKLKEFTPEEIKPKPFIGGNDLINLGLKPGPVFKKILDEVSDLQLENKLTTREKALKYIEALVVNKLI